MIKDNTKLLYFPKLVLIGETTKGRGYNEKSKIYKLDWTDFNNRQKNNYISWSNNWLKDGYKFKGNYTTILDKKRMKLMTEQEFIIPLSYMKRIKHYAELAHKEWNESNPFDTNVRETCLDVAESSVYVSFYLLKDCIYGTDNYNFVGKLGKIDINNVSDLVVLVNEYYLCWENTPQEERPHPSLRDFGRFIGYTQEMLEELKERDIGYKQVLTLIDEVALNDLEQKGLRGTYVASINMHMMKAEHKVTEDKSVKIDINTKITTGDRITSRILDALTSQIDQAESVEELDSNE